MSSIWQEYESRLATYGNTIRDVQLNRERLYITNKMLQHPSFHHTLIDNVEKDVVIVNSDNLEQKTIFGLPGDEIIPGSLVYWMEDYWLVTETDINDEVYSKGKMERCNYLLRFIDKNGQVQERWSIVEDGTKSA